MADHVIGALDSNGFLTQTDAEVAAATGVEVSDVEQVLAAMRGLEPIGIGSRSIAESLLAQVEYLREQGEVEIPPFTEAVVADHLADIGERRFREAAAAVGATARDVMAVWEFVKANLNPYPTAAFTAAVSGDSTRTIVRPDVIIRNVEGELVVEVVESRRFSLHIAPIYSSLSAQLRASETTADEKQHVREYVGRARFFIDNINRRRATIHRITEALVERQRDYLLHGVQHLVPLTRAEIGERIGMHESTVSRATAEKYVMIPSGEVVPFSHFFTASLGVKDQIRRMIAAEDRPTRAPTRRSRTRWRRRASSSPVGPSRSTATSCRSFPPASTSLTHGERRRCDRSSFAASRVIGAGGLVLAGVLYVASTVDARPPTVLECGSRSPWSMTIGAPCHDERGSRVQRAR